MADHVAEFFDGLGHRGPEPLLRMVRGTLRFDLDDGERGIDHWIVLISEGAVSAVPGERDSDCAVRTERSFFGHLVRGEANLVAGLLRNQVRVQGEIMLMNFFKRLLPSVPGAHDPRELVRGRRGR